MNHIYQKILDVRGEPVCSIPYDYLATIFHIWKSLAGALSRN